MRTAGPSMGLNINRTVVAQEAVLYIACGLQSAQSSNVR
jgi:hypothetical protein